MYSDRVVLVVEDNISDVRLLEMASKKDSSGVQLKAVKNANEAFQYLNKAAPFEDAKTPDIILLDLNIPGMSGKEVLAKLKSDSQFKAIPVIVLSSSNYVRDVQECYALQANCYLRKPTSVKELSMLWEMIVVFWVRSAELV